MFSYVSPEERVPQDHPLRAIREMTDQILKQLSAEFDAMYSRRGRPSIPPEKLLRALLLQVLYTVRSERQLMEQLDYNLLFRWFVGLNMDDAVWDATVYTKNRQRLLEADVADIVVDTSTGRVGVAGVPAHAFTWGELAERAAEEDGTLRVQPCKSPVWDTALGLRALSAHLRSEPV